MASLHHKVFSFFLFFLLLLLFLLFLLPLSNVSAQTIVCDPQKISTMGMNMDLFPFCDKRLTYQVRAKDLVDRLTLEEKAGLLGDRSVGVKRFNIRPYNWWSEALHGVSDQGHRGVKFDNITCAATDFPTVILTSASFNETLWKTIAEVVSDEARAMYNVGLAELTYWSPVINIARDPRWGRINEISGEDPFVMGRYAVNYVRGLQDVKSYEKADDPNMRPLKVAACCKHYAAYDLDNWDGIDRFHFDAKVTERDMKETFVKPFEMCIKDGDVASVMCSYNKVNGIPSCADPKLLNDTIRGIWDLHGYIVADCDSIEVMVDYHRYLNDSPEEAVGQALKAGLDLDCGDYSQIYASGAVKKGLVAEGVIDKSLSYLFIVLMRLGWFDGSPGNYGLLGRSDICTLQNLDLSVDAARQGIVLLKNDDNLLPLESKVKHPKLAVVGPHANATTSMMGDYALTSGIACRYITPLGGIQEYAHVNYAPGCPDVKCKNNSGIPKAVQATKGVDATIIFVGLDLSLERENIDRMDLNLPGSQEDLINAILNGTSTGPVILVILSAGGVDISAFKDHPKVSAILWAGYPGAEGGRAIADVIFGNYNPAGRLPITWYPSDYILNFPMTSMQLRPVSEKGYPGRTYKFYNGSTVYPFGYGLSYTKFKYTITSAPHLLVFHLAELQKCKPIQFLDGSSPNCPAILVEESNCMEIIQITTRVQNTGTRDGSNVMILYSVPPRNIVGVPIKRVVAFRRVFVKTGEYSDEVFYLRPCEVFSIVGDDAYELLPGGEHLIVLGDGAEAVETKISVQIQ